MIQVNELSKKYGDKIIFENIFCSLENRHIYGLAGINGIGKSTLLNAITQPDSIDYGIISTNHKSSRRKTSKAIICFQFGTIS